MQESNLHMKPEELPDENGGSSPSDQMQKTDEGVRADIKEIENIDISNLNNNEDTQQTLSQRIHTYIKDKFCTETEVIGVEIQPDMIRICQAVQDNITSKWKISKISSTQVLNTYNYESLSKNKHLYVKALKESFKDNKITNKNIAISIPASMAIIKVVSLPLMTPQNLEKATRIESFWKNLVQLSGDLKDYSMFYRVIEEHKASKEMDVLFVACKNDDLNLYRNIAEEAGMNVVVADIGCFSINNLSKLKEDKSNETEVYLKIGKDENYLQVLEENKPYIYDIFVPENEKAYLNEYLEHQTFQQRFTAQVKHILTKHEDNFQSNISKIHIISDEKQISQFTKSLDNNLDKISVTEADLFKNIKLRKSIRDNDEFNENRSAWAVSAGLATRNIQIFDNDDKKSISETTNLLPEADLIKEKLKSDFYSKVIIGSVALLSVLFVLTFGIYSYGKYKNNIIKITEFNRLNKQYSEKQKLFDEINNASGSLNKLVKLRKNLPSNQAIIIQSFEEISRNIPEGIWLEKIKINKKHELEISGKSFGERNIIKFSKTFENSGNISDINIGSMKTVTAESGRLIKEFIINGKLGDK